eukprot:5557799-Lingulodinium_polyedra.AAC.1
MVAPPGGRRGRAAARRRFGARGFALEGRGRGERARWCSGPRRCFRRAVPSGLRREPLRRPPQR